MITITPLARHPRAGSRWQRELADAITRPELLLQRLRIDPQRFPDALDAAAERAAKGFPLRVPESFVRRMRPGDPADPLLRQVLPLACETAAVDGFVADPLGEAEARRAPGLLHKYAGRALLVTTGACAVHCRYCFRRDYDYAADAALDGALDVIAGDPSIEEVLLSGGDPLVLGDRKLASLLHRLRSIPHVRRLRLHTRTAIVLPSRVDDGLLEALAGPVPLVIVVHANHAAEIDDDVRTALARLRSVATAVLNQSVLLRGVNDDADVLRGLSTTLFGAGVLPYYLHLLDPVSGTAHFDVPESRARALMQELVASLPGYLVPKLVRERAGEPSKTPIDLSVAGRT